LLGKHFSSLFPFIEDYGTEPKRKITQRAQNSKMPEKEDRVLPVRKRRVEDHEESYRLLYL
jgi:hypothetical protein